MKEIKDKLYRELKELEQKKEWSAYDIENLERITGSLANLEELGGGESYGREYSGNRGSWEAMGSYGGGGSYGRGESYGGGESYGYDGGNSGRRRHYVRGHYSRGRGMDEGREMMIERMEALMEESEGRDRETIRRCLDMLQR